MLLTSSNERYRKLQCSVESRMYWKVGRLISFPTLFSSGADYQTVKFPEKEYIGLCVITVYGRFSDDCR